MVVGGTGGRGLLVFLLFLYCHYPHTFQRKSQPQWLSWMCVRLVIRRLWVWSGWVGNILLWRFDHEIFSTVILSLPLIQEGQLSVSGKAGLGGSVGCAVRLETRRSLVQPTPRLATFFRGDWSWNIFYGHSLPSADSRRAVVSFWRKNVHNTG